MKVHSSAQFQYTIRGIPREVDAALRRRSEQEKVSLNQIVVDELVRSTIGSERKADFSELVGKWVDDPQFDEVIKAQRQIDWDKWK